MSVAVKMLRCLAEANGRPVAFGHLIDTVWQDRSLSGRLALRVTAHRIRRQISSDGLEAVTGYGYRLDPNSQLAKFVTTLDEREIVIPRHGSQPMRLYRRLKMAEGRIVANNALVHAIWGSDPDGGPMNAPDLISRFIFTLRSRLPDGAISSFPHVGYRLAPGVVLP